MSRVSRYKNEDDLKIKKAEWNVALYLRLSRVDDDEKDESESIASQKAMLSKFAMSNPDFNIVDFYIDDGFSGTNFDRPNFQRMWQDIRNGKVNCVAVKDLSRFGRNTIETDNYLEVIFPTLKIRFISLLEELDTFLNPELSNQKLLIAFKNLMNDEYARDISTKVRTSNAAHRRKGDFIGSFAPYGYKKDPNNHHKLIIDEEAAEVVKKIFDMYLNGKSVAAVAKELNELEYTSPIDYKKMKGDKLHIPQYSICKYHLWSPTTVDTILRNEMYIGNMVQGKRCVVSYKNKKKIDKPREEWDIVPNTHEPIISKEDFEKTQIKLKNAEIISIKPYKTNILSGLVRCGDCGLSMNISKCSSENLKGKYYFKCSTYGKNPMKCSKHSIRNDKLENIVFDIIKQYIDLSVNIDNIINKIDKSKFKIGNNTNEKLKLQRERDILSYKQRLGNYYLKLKSGKISEIDYRAEKEKIENQIKVCENQIITLSATLNNNVENAHNNFVTALKKYKNFNSLTKEMAQELIDVIYVYENNRIEINFKFQDEFDAVINYLKDNSLI
ncbi:MAG: recombinase family protein [Clostridia bacterium]|nr:recombinase family protein [Clostridia bacterium]